MEMVFAGASDSFGGAAISFPVADPWNMKRHDRRKGSNQGEKINLTRVQCAAFR
jgi:hypothetical protein